MTNTLRIPRIIHQVYEGRDNSSPPSELIRLSRSWKELNPDWEYYLWDYRAIDQFLENYYPNFINIYNNYKYDVQRWDAIRYLIIYQHGGLYVDMDYQCIEKIEDILIDKECCLGTEPPEHSTIFGVQEMIGNAFIASIPKHPFIGALIDEIQKDDLVFDNHEVMHSTGPLMVTRVYDNFEKKEDIRISYKLVTPLTKQEIRAIILGRASAEIKQKIAEAYAIHYFWGSWLNQIPNWKPIYFVDYL